MQRHGDLRIRIFNDPIFQENGMLVWIEGRSECWIVDPGLPPQPEQMFSALRESNLRPAAILLTHCHADHIAGVGPLREIYDGLPIIAPAGEVELLVSAEANLSAALGMPVVAPPATDLLEPGQTIELGPTVWQVLDASGHSPGGLAYYCADRGVALVGDAVFAEGIGRTDFPHSDHARLIRNIRGNLLTLPEETMLYPGHGPAATISDILTYNQTWRMESRRGPFS